LRHGARPARALALFLVTGLGTAVGRAQEPAPSPTPAVSPSPSPAPSPAPSAERPVDKIEITGHTRIATESIWATLGVKPGGRLRRDPAGLPRLLESQYHILGYPAARATVRYDEDARTLFVEVDEGRVAGLDLVGVPRAEQARVAAILDVKPGAPFSDEELSDGLRRLLSEAHGAYESEGDPPYTLERVAEGVRVSVHLRRRPATFRVSPAGTGRAPYFNRVDGFAPGASAGALLLAPSAFNPVELYADANYGFAADRLSYDAGLRRDFGPRRTVVVGYEHHDFTDTDDAFRALGAEYLRGLHIFFSVFHDYYRRRGDEAYVGLRATPHLQFGVNYRHDRYLSLPVVSDGTLIGNVDPSPNPTVDEGSAHALLFTGRWSWKEPLFASEGDDRSAFLARSPLGTAFQREQVLRLEASYERADADALGGDLTYDRFTGRASGAARLSPRTWLLGTAAGGTGSTLPVQRLFRLGGQGTLRGRPFDALSGDRMVSGTAELLYEAGGHWPALVAFYDGGTAWTAGTPRTEWRHDGGVGLAWPASSSRLVRIDFAWPLNAAGEERKLRVTGYVRLPF